MRTLLLSTNDLGPRAGNEIAAMLRKNRYITAIDLSENHMGPKVRHMLELPHGGHRSVIQ